MSAACIFPITQRADLDRALGFTYRAALGLTEESDAIVVVVSEETGIVSICHRGLIERSFDPESLIIDLPSSSPGKMKVILNNWVAKLLSLALAVNPVVGHPPEFPERPPRLLILNWSSKSFQAADKFQL